MPSIFRDHPRIGCCGATCGDSCAACCDNVVYEDKITFTYNNAWPDTAPDEGWPGCDAGTATGTITLTSVFADFIDPPGEYGEPYHHPCQWLFEVGVPTDLGTPTCDDTPTVDGICVPGGGIPGCYPATYKITRAFFRSLCKVAPQDPESPYAGMSQIGDGTAEPALCTVSAGTSKAGWMGDISITNSGLCLTTGAGVCSRTDLINTKGVGLFPGDLEGFRTYGPCAGGSLGCPDWRCCDPFSMLVYLGAWVLNDPEDISIWPHTRDYFECEASPGFPNGVAHIADVDYDLATIPSIQISADHTCVPSGMSMMAKVRGMSDSRLNDVLRRLLAEAQA